VNVDNEDITLSASDGGQPPVAEVSPLDDVQSVGREVTLSAPNKNRSASAVLEAGSLRIADSFAEIFGGGASVHDVASLILRILGPMTVMKLQKLVYYCQAWSLVWDEEPLFSDEIEAWANGPVVRSLYKLHQGAFKIDGWYGNPDHLTEVQKETVLKVLEFYGGMTSQELSDLTHNEDPWRRARVGLQPGERGCRVIPHADMAEYYSSL